MTYQCPICHLRYSFMSELEHHARSDHAAERPVERRDHITRYREQRPAPRFVTPSM